MHSVPIEFLETETVGPLLESKATLMVILWTPNAWFQILHFEVCFFKLEAIEKLNMFCLRRDIPILIFVY